MNRHSKQNWVGKQSLQTKKNLGADISTDAKLSKELTQIWNTFKKVENESLFSPILERLALLNSKVRYNNKIKNR